MNLRVLSRNALSSVVQVTLSAIALFALFRVLTHFLSIAQVGLWSLVMASTSLARVTEFGLGGGVVRFIASDLGRGDRRSAAQTAFMGLVLVFLFVGFAAIALFPVFASVLAHILPAAQLTDGLALLPYAVVSLVLGTVGNVFLSILEGCQRSDLRATIQISSSLVQLAAALWLVPHAGLLSLGPIQVIQSAFVLFVSAILAAQQLDQPFAMWLGWDRSRVRELVRYGGGTQIAAVGQLLFDPTVKLLLTVFGGLAFTGYYEMANRMILQFRSVIVSAFNTLVPFMANRLSRDGLEQKALRDIYVRAFHLMIAIAIPYFGLIGASLPLIMVLWLGHYYLRFLAIAAICLAGWALNTAIAPAYFLYLAVGRLRWTVISHLTIGTLNLIFAWLGGKLFGGYGVLAGSACALAAGSAVTIVAFHRDYDVRFSTLIQSRTLGLLAISAVGAMGSLVSYSKAVGPLQVKISVLGPAILAAALIPLLWKHPACSDLFTRLFSRRS